ncbi:hypothetical protein EMIT074MI3_40012 [Bacillus licheniformis]
MKKSPDTIPMITTATASKVISKDLILSILVVLLSYVKSFGRSGPEVNTTLLS